MRALKFRAWIHHNQLLPPVTLEELVVLNAGRGFAEDIFIMQFTGFLDRNGNEIYYGDIVQDAGKEGEDSYGLVCTDRESGGYRIAGLETEAFRAIAGRCIVVGNVFEHRNLHSFLNEADLAEFGTDSP